MNQDEQIQSFIEAYEAEIFRKWATSADTDTREELYRLKVTLDAFKIHIRHYIDNDKIMEFMEKTGTG